MIIPATLNLAADRHTPFRSTLTFTGVDLTGATMEMHIRESREDTGTPPVDLDTVGAITTEGLYLVSAVEIDGVDVSTVSIHIDEATIEAVPAASQQADDKILYHDLQITPSGGLKQVYASGQFTIRAGVTQ